MRNKLNWEVYSSESRAWAIDKIKEIISTNGGCIINFNMFSDLALTLSVEVEENRIPELYNALSSTLKVSDFDAENIRTESTKEWLLFMNISFGGGEGKLKGEVPAIPG